MTSKALQRLTLALVTPASFAAAQSPYGLAARQTIPLVIHDSGTIPEEARWTSEVDVYNPHPYSIKVRVAFFGAVGTATPQRVDCDALDVGARSTRQLALDKLCPLNPGISEGRLELQSEIAGTRPDPATGALVTIGDASDVTFLASAHTARNPIYGHALFAVEGFPQGNLGGAPAIVTGLKHGLVGGSLWRSFCYAAALNEATPVKLTLFDENGQSLGTAFDIVDPQQAREMTSFTGNQQINAFAAVGAPDGNYDNVTAEFIAPNTQQVGYVAFCRILNQTQNSEVFAIAKYSDLFSLPNSNRDEARQHLTVSGEDRLGRPYWARVGHPQVGGEPVEVFESSYHLAYFQHPDTLRCVLEELPRPDLAVAGPLLQMRLIDPDDNVVALSTVVDGHSQVAFASGEKSAYDRGRNGRWLVEVGARTAVKGPGCESSPCPHGTAVGVDYKLVCSSGNGHSQLDFIHQDQCGVRCAQTSGGFTCAFGPVDRYGALNPECADLH